MSHHIFPMCVNIQNITYVLMYDIWEIEDGKPYFSQVEVGKITDSFTSSLYNVSYTYLRQQHDI